MCRSIDSRTLPQVDERGHRKREIRPHRDAGIDLSTFGEALVAAVTKAGTTSLIFFQTITFHFSLRFLSRNEAVGTPYAARCFARMYSNVARPAFAA